MTRFEAARTIGLRAVQLSEGMLPAVNVTHPHLMHDYVYVAALELYTGKTDACILRDGMPIHVSTMTLPQEVVAMLNSRDGASRVR